jgi:hypothetical protein
MLLYKLMLLPPGSHDIAPVKRYKKVRQFNRLSAHVLHFFRICILGERRVSVVGAE